MGVLLSMAALLAAVPAAPTVRVSDFGCDADDSTRFIQAALDAGAETVILDRKGSPWMADSVFLRSNTRLVFEPGVELCARKGALADPRATLLSFLAVTNVTVSGAGGTVRLRREDYAKPPYRASQHRHAIACRGGVNVTVEGLTVVGAGGDGVYVCGDRTGNPTRNLTVRDVTVTNSYRQGMSVISVKGLLVERVKLLGTRGTAPEAGIDFEPNFPTEFLQEIVVRDTLASGNAGNGFGFSLWRRTAEHPPVTARFENCRVEGGDCSVFYQSDSPNQSFPQGGISFRNCTFANAARAAVRLSQKPKRAMSFRFENCRAENCGGKRVPEILLYPGQRDDPPTDGIDFGDFEIVRGAEQSGKRFFEAPTGDWMPEGVTDLTGRITLVEPSGSRTVALDETWRKATFRPASVGATPARLEPDVANLDVRDVAPGAWRELTAIPVRFKSRWLVWAERPRRIRLRVAQAKVTVYKASQKPLRLVDPNGRKLAEFPMPVFEAPGEIAFDAPMRGLYALAADVSGNTFAITASDAPVALDVGTEPLQLMGLRGTVRFCAADAFALFTRGQGSVRLTDPQGADCVSYAGAYGWNRYLGKGAPGLFALSIDSRTLHLDLLGAQGHLFPDAGRSWTTGPKPLDPFPFPDRLSACVWRNWGLVPTERLAATLGATADEITALAGEMGLKPDPVVLPAWRRKGYITIVRRNWHLLPEEQILQLIDMDAQEFAYRLKEDDFLWHKLGFLKPSCGPLAYTAAAADAGRAARRRIAEILKEEGVDPDAAEEPRFAFVDELKSLDALRPSRPSHPSPFTFRMISSYFADYGDPLVDDEIGSFPEGLLQKLADEGVNAVWMHVVLNTLVKDARYPEFGSGSERRIANLKKLVARAQKYGIKVYLYLNEPRCLPAAFFEKEGRAAMRGAVEAKKGVAALCTSVPEVRRWLKDSLAALFAEVKGLGGVFTITMSENLTNCASHSRRETCPRCKGRSVAEILAEVNRTAAEGVAAGDPSAETIVWNWGWPKGVEKDVFPKLPKRNCRVMHVSENGIPVTVGGVTVPEHDYSIAIVGPGENAKSFWRTARANGLPVLAKVQACNSWELSSFPFIPALDLVAEQAANLTREGVEGVMLSWSCGSAPAMNLRVYGGESLDEIAADVYGAAAAPFVRRAWTAYSEGFRRYPFDIVTVYKGPMQWGPANPLYPKPTGYQATMVGFPYDALRFGTWDNQWHGRFPVEAWIARFDEVAQGFAEGNRLFAEALAHVEPAKRAAAERDLAMFRAEEMHFRSTVDQSRFILARDAGNTSEIRRLALKELATAKAYLPLVRADSRIGYECSNHYYYVPRDVVEKILACRLIADAAKPRTVRKPEISWSVMHPIVVEPGYMKRLVAKAAEYGGVDSFEICGECNQKHGGLNGLLAYEPYPKTAAAVDHAVVETYRRKLRETVAIAHAAGKPVYFWHREGFMPKTMHEDVPGLLDEDGEYDLLGKPYLDYVRWKVCEAFRQVPELDGVVLTLTEADFSVIHNSRPDRYPPAKVVETITRIFLEEHRRLGKRLIFRSFGSIKSDYESLIAGANACADDYDFEIETKITPYDFSPFLPANPYLKKTSRCTIGAECDGLGEYLGCGYLPCAQVEAIRRYVGYGRAADVDRYTIRIDRVGNSIFDSAQEVNLYAYHRFIQDPSATVERVLDEWAAKRWPKCAAEMKELAAKSFRLVEATQFIDHNVCFHQNPPPPSFRYVKFSGIFGTFRDGMDLHMTEPMWGMMSSQKTPGRAAIRAEKALAERLATEGFAKLQTLKGRLDPAEYARQFRAWSIAAKAVPAMRAYYDCVCAYFDDMDANDAAATRLTAAIAAAEKVILPRMKSTKVDLSEFNLNACRARGEDLDKVYFVTFLWLSRELLNEYRADFAARQKFLSRADVLDFVIPGGIYDDVRVRRVMHASYQTIDGGVPVRFVGNAAFPNGTIAVEFRDVPGAKVEIDADPAYAKDFNVSETVANGLRTVTIAKKGAAYPGIRSIALVRPPVNACETRQSLRETSWLWGHETGQVDGPKNNWGLAPATNGYPMVEAAKSLGLESLNVIRWDCPDKAFRDTLRGLRRVTWPMCGIPKAGVEASFDALCDWNFRIAEEMPNVTGFDLDDFFRPDKKRREFFVETPSGRRRACPTSFPYEKLVALRKRMDAFPRPLELRTVVYDDLFHQCLSPEDLLPLLELTDVVTYWTWKGASTDRLEENFATLRRLVPTKRIQLGIYLYDFGDKKEMDVRYLERQLAFGLARWRRGEIEGFVFLCSSLCNRDTPAVRLVRDWLKRHGDETRTASAN